MLIYRKRGRIFFAAFLILLAFNPLLAQEEDNANEVSIVPAPLHVTRLSGDFLLNEKVSVLFEAGSADLEAIANQFADKFAVISGFKLDVMPVGAKFPKRAIVLMLKQDTLGNEGYRLSVTKDNIVLTATEPSGIFYGIQSLFQLLPATVTLDKNITIPGIDIMDKPRFGWRGLMLDVGRYFYSVDYIKKYIDYLSMHKMNRFHWHLTESHGWRIEIKKYPRLTSIGAWRAGTQFGKGDQIDKNPHGGYYTQDEIRDIVAYAQSKYVTIVPEIEMPGHSYAALVAYPELACDLKSAEMPVEWDGPTDIFCAGKEFTFTFLEGVLDEVITLFPGDFIHIGGDEATKDHWKSCAHCQKRIQEEGLNNVDELQRYFVTRIGKFLHGRGKRMIGWDEILEGGLAPDAAVMSWRGIKGGIEAAKMHHLVVMSPAWYMYFDYYQGEPHLEPYAIGGFLPLKKVYDYEPVPDELNPHEAKFIMGVQGNVWAEFIHNTDYLEYMTYPRAAALAEVAWSAPENKNWQDFTRRLEDQYVRYEREGLHFSKSAYNVTIDVRKDSLRNEATIRMSADAYRPDIRYTIDGTEPHSNSMRYNNPFQVKSPSTVKAAVFRAGKRVNKVNARSIVPGL